MLISNLYFHSPRLQAGPELSEETGQGSSASTTLFNAQGNATSYAWLSHFIGHKMSQEDMN